MDTALELGTGAPSGLPLLCDVCSLCPLAVASPNLATNLDDDTRFALNWTLFGEECVSSNYSNCYTCSGTTRTASFTPSVTPTVSVTSSISLSNAPSASNSPSVCPSSTPSISVSPSPVSSSPTPTPVSSSLSPSPSTNASTPSVSVTTGLTPSATPTSSGSTSLSPTPSLSASPAPNQDVYDGLLENATSASEVSGLAEETEALVRSAIDSGNLPRAREFIDNYTQAVLRTAVPQPSALDALVVALAAVMAKYPQALSPSSGAIALELLQQNIATPGTTVVVGTVVGLAGALLQAPEPVAGPTVALVVQDSAARDVALGGSVNVTVGAFQLYAAADTDPEVLVQQVAAALKGIVTIPADLFSSVSRKRAGAVVGVTTVLFDTFPLKTSAPPRTLKTKVLTVTMAVDGKSVPVTNLASTQAVSLNVPENGVKAPSRKTPPKCAFWNSNINDWDGTGCSEVVDKKTGVVTCIVSHTTDFAVVYSTEGMPDDDADDRKSDSSTNVGMVVGIVLGVVCGLAVLVILAAVVAGIVWKARQPKRVTLGDSSSY